MVLCARLQFFASDFCVVDYFLFAAFDKFNFFHVRVAENVIHAPGFAECLFGDEPQCAFGAFGYALWFSAAEVAFDWLFDVRVRENGAEGTCVNAFHAADALLLIEVDDAVGPRECICGAGVCAGRSFALAADNGHADDWMRIGYDYAHRAFFGIVHAEVVQYAREFAYFAARTEFGDDSQFFRHVMSLPEILLSIGRQYMQYAGTAARGERTALYPSSPEFSSVFGLRRI